MVMVKQEIPSQITEAINRTLDLMKSGNLPDIVAVTMFPSNNSPFSTWSLFNRINCMFMWQLHNQGKFFNDKKEFDQQAYLDAFKKIDFRGFNQWNGVERNVTKGQKSYAYILVPLFKKAHRKYWENETGSKHFLYDEKNAPEGRSVKSEEYNYIYGFRGMPVFNIDQTKGKPVEYQELQLPEFPFMQVAKFLNISVTPVAGNKKFYGAFMPTLNRIELATPEEATFFHELAHAVDHYLLIKSGKKGLKGGQQVDQEIVADFSSAVLCSIAGLKFEEKVARSKKYIQHYTGLEDPSKEIMKLFSRIEAIVDFITNFKENKSPEVEVKEDEKIEKTQAEELADKPDGKTAKVVAEPAKKSAKKKVENGK